MVTSPVSRGDDSVAHGPGARTTRRPCDVDYSAIRAVPFARHASWDVESAPFADAVIATLAAYAPDLPSLILRRQVITPADLETNYGLTGGHIFHGELALDQLFTMRPLLGWARYRTPIRGLYMCGSGTHPGYGVSGLSGMNAAREILKE